VGSGDNHTALERHLRPQLPRHLSPPRDSPLRYTALHASLRA
jgi:hypothetical protein